MTKINKAKVSAAADAAKAKADQAAGWSMDVAQRVATNPAARNVGKGVAIGFGATIGYIAAVKLANVVL